MSMPITIPAGLSADAAATLNKWATPETRLFAPDAPELTIESPPDQDTAATLAKLNWPQATALLTDRQAAVALPWVAVTRIRMALAQMRPELSRVLQARMGTPRQTLRALADDMERSPERIRQFYTLALTDIHSATGLIIARLATARAALDPEIGFTAPLSEPDWDHWTEQPFQLADDAERTIAAGVLRLALGWTKARAGRLRPEVTDAAGAAHITMKQRSEPHGIFSVEEWGEVDLKTRLGRRWRKAVDAVIEAAQPPLHRLTANQCGFQATKAMRLRAILLDHGEPMPMRDLMTRAGIRGRPLPNASMTKRGLVRTANRTISLAEWGHEAPRKIAQTLSRRIHESGGTIPKDRIPDLINEVAKATACRPQSVRAFLLYADIFQTDEATGDLRLLEPQEIKLPALVDEPELVEDGDALKWQFQVTKSHMEGFPVVNVPRNLVARLGCSPNERIEGITLDHPPDCGTITASWRLTVTTGPQLGRLSRALRRLGAEKALQDNGRTPCAEITVLGEGTARLALIQGKGP